LRALGVTGSRRSPVAPDIPTVAESGVPGYEVLQWYGVLAPAATPREIVERVQRAIATALQDPKVRERIAADGGEPVGNGPDAFGAIMRADYQKWGDVIRKAGIKVES